MELADRFTADCWDISARSKKELGYSATRFNQMLEQNGGVPTARHLIKDEKPSDGFTFFWEHKRLDLTVEALAILPWYAALFTPDEVAAARRRLGDYRFDIAGYLSRAAAAAPEWVRSRP
jgi:hypothetical protein